jgi:isopenicillin-N N-acyltransferase-like protein
MLYGEDGALAHTNFFVDPQMQTIENDPDELVAKRIRYHRATRMLAEETLHTIKSLQAIQRDHINHPHSICNHDENIPNPIERSKTICALVMDLTSRAMHISWGNPCENAYHTYYLDA